jgi:hypothetical protein
VRRSGRRVIARRRSELHYRLKQSDQRPRAAGDPGLDTHRRHQGGEPDQWGQTGEKGASKAHASSRSLAQADQRGSSMERRELAEPAMSKGGPKRAGALPIQPLLLCREE